MVDREVERNDAFYGLGLERRRIYISVILTLAHGFFF